MPKVSIANIKNLNAVFLILLLLIGFFGNLWLSYKQIEAGTKYFYLFIFGTVSLLLIFLIMKEGDSVLNKIKIPISSSYFKGVFMFFFGIFIVLTLYFIGTISNLTFFTEQMPKSFSALTSFNDNNNLKPFAVLEAQNDPFFTFYVYGISASINEEWVTGIVLNIIGFLASFIILKYIFKITAPNLITIIILGFLVSIIIFSILHSFNNTYTKISDFIFAGVFRSIINVLVFIFNFGIEFGIGAHSMNNILYLGKEKIIEAISTTGGVVTLIIIFSLLVSLLIEKNFKREIINVFKSLKPSLT